MISQTFGFLILVACAAAAALPAPISNSFDASLRFASGDLPIDQGVLLRTATGMAPEGVHITLAGPGAMYIQWSTGAGKVEKNANIAAYDVASVPSVVKYGTTSGKYDTTATGTGATFNQIYNSPTLDDFNYTSPIIHTVKISGLTPLTTYYYTVGDGASQTSKEYSFTAPRATGTYPQRFAYFGDMGTTFNSSATLDHLIASTAADSKNAPVVAFTGDFVYADQYLSNGSFKLNVSASAGKGTPGIYPSSVPGRTYQPRWDAWARFMEPLTSKFPFLVTFGNHEIEKGDNGAYFIGAVARYKTPANESNSANPTYYSADISGAHLITLNNYIAYNTSSPQYKWLAADLAAVDRTKTPFIIVQTHTPIYNTYNTHYKEGECFRQAGMEKLFFDYGVNLVLHGHIHAYERINPVYNYTVNACAPAYITIGDAGNAEGTYAFFVDQAGQCPAVPVNATASYQPDQFGTGIGLVGTPLACPSLLDGGANGGYCPASQPAWSAFREPSFGHGTLDLLNSTTAFWQWHRNQDGVASVSDKTYYTIDKTACPNMAGGKKATA